MENIFKNIVENISEKICCFNWKVFLQLFGFRTKVEKPSLHQSDPWWPCSGLLLVGPSRALLSASFSFLSSWQWSLWLILFLCWLLCADSSLRVNPLYCKEKLITLIPRSLLARLRLTECYGRKAIVVQVCLNQLLLSYHLDFFFRKCIRTFTCQLMWDWIECNEGLSWPGQVCLKVKSSDHANYLQLSASHSSSYKISIIENNLLPWCFKLWLWASCSNINNW